MGPDAAVCGMDPSSDEAGYVTVGGIGCVPPPAAAACCACNSCVACCDLAAAELNPGLADTRGTAAAGPPLTAAATGSGTCCGYSDASDVGPEAGVLLVCVVGICHSPLPEEDECGAAMIAGDGCGGELGALFQITSSQAEMRTECCATLCSVTQTHTATEQCCVHSGSLLLPTIEHSRRQRSQRSAEWTALGGHCVRASSGTPRSLNNATPIAARTAVAER